MDDLLALSIAELGRAYRDGALSPVTVTEAALARIAETNPSLRAFNTVTAEKALQQAEAAETNFKAKVDLGPLQGVPYGIKDIYDTAGVLTSCQSRLRPDVVPDANATAVQALEDGGAVMLGKCATIEFATGGPSEDTLFPPARNPWNLDHVPGGSSSGSGAAVAAGLTRMALGSDTGGSIRGPAALCGTVGLKPTYGRVSRRGVFPLSYSMDHCGPLTWTVEDAALTLGVLAGHDPADPGSADVPAGDYMAGLDTGAAGLRLAYPVNWIEEQGDADPAVIAAFETALEVFRDLGATVEPVALQSFDRYHACGRLIVLAECYSIHERDLQTRPELYGRPTRERLMAGAFVRGSDYVTAQRLRRELAHEVESSVLGTYDALLAPTFVRTAQRFDEMPSNPMKLGGMMTQPFNVTGSPALALCSGFHENGLPISIQIAGRMFDEAMVLRLGAAYEAATAWRDVRPTLSQDMAAE
ncbi:MAG: amidase [Pseudomonadota bacterium]